MEMTQVYSAIASLLKHGLENGLFEKEDGIYTRNLLLARLHLDAWEDAERDDYELETALKYLLDYAAEKGLLEADSVVFRDLFDTELMNCLLPRPSEVVRKFNELYKEDPKKATDFYYAFSRASDYIRTYRVAKDMKWEADTEYGEMIVTINLSKPEKDPKAIAAALKAAQSSYPKCQLCAENEGYAGRVNHPARQNHRIIPITINNSDWFLQYSPYVYYNEHCIVFNKEHTPMKIDHAAFDKLLDFIRQFPHYMVGSNADLPIVGGSILTHDHFQGGNFEFPMLKADTETEVVIKGYENIKAGIIKWPMSVLKLTGDNPAELADCADSILLKWRGYTDEEAFVYAFTDGVPHNTITPIARMHEGKYELYLVLRNNITTDEHPDGVYHPHKEHHHIKKENIGLIEVMGLAILPARLKTELEGLREFIIAGKNVSDDEVLSKHAEWVDMIIGKYDAERLKNAAELDNILRYEVGQVYKDLLEQCAVFKRTEQGREQFIRFINA